MNRAAAIHCEDLAGDERRIEEQIFYRARDIRRRADALERSLPHDAAALGGGEMLALVGPEDRAGRDTIHAHVGAKLERERAREAGEPRLRDRIHDEILERALGVD